MKKILFATDFSYPAHNGYQYAYQLSKALKTSLKVLYVAPESEEHFFNSEKLNQTLAAVDGERYEKALRRFITKYPDQYQDDEAALDHVSYLYKKGEIVEQIIKTAKEEESDLILLGTRNKHNLWDHLFGSTTTDLIKRSPISVMVIPHQAKYQPIKKIAFANAFDLDKKLELTKIQQLASQLEATLQQVHVDLDASEADAKKEKTSFYYGSSNPFTSMAVVRDKAVSIGLNYFINHHPVDLLAMSIPERGGLESLFHKSQTKAMAYNTTLPLLICK